jgi:hypothetical protein
MFDGFRGAPRADRAALVNVLQQISTLVEIVQGGASVVAVAGLELAHERALPSGARAAVEQDEPDRVAIALPEADLAPRDVFEPSPVAQAGQRIARCLPAKPPGEAGQGAEIGAALALCGSTVGIVVIAVWNAAIQRASEQARVDRRLDERWLFELSDLLRTSTRSDEARCDRLDRRRRRHRRIQSRGGADVRAPVRRRVR